MEEEDYEFYIGENARAGSVFISEINGTKPIPSFKIIKWIIYKYFLNNWI